MAVSPPARRRRLPLAAAGLAVAIAGGILGARALSTGGAPVRVFAGGWHTCAIKAGAIFCWGRNSEGQLGDGTTTDSPIRRAVEGLPGTATTLAAGERHTCALLDGGTVACWGASTSGQLGLVTPTATTRPVVVAGLAAIRALAAGAEHTCALDAYERVLCWGANAAGQRGDGGDPRPRPRPQPVRDLAGVVEIQAARDNSCAVVSSGRVHCWGANGSGQLGRAPGAASAVPVAVDGVSAARAVAVGGAHACALLSSGRVHCWGDNLFGQLGRGVAGPPDWRPAPVVGLDDVVSIDAGSSFTCARRREGTVSCWGKAEWGNIGDGQAASIRDGPSKVLDFDETVALAAGYQHACAVPAGGGLGCWGLNDSGQLGDGTAERRSRPVSVNGIR
jgi:alpha-tubulin suppressor-like RCC1 family protein